MRFRPISPDGLARELGERVAATEPGRWLRVAVDGAPAARPEDLADAVAARVRLRGRDVVRVRAADYLRPASLRFEHGRTDPDAYYSDWLDLAALSREVLAPLEPGGSGRVRPVHWDATVDRASRAAPVPVGPGGVALVSGGLLLGAGLAFDLVVHLSVSPAALARRTPEDLLWTLPAFERYAAEVAPELIADVVVRVDDPRHPALALLGEPSSR
ncbi:uridine kinase [Luedemannella flava]|uniref:Uridine kinase n=1 Tax=Luedemannella flava TaxID=349316 RepID=A0ABP4YR23_9ACTN